MANSNDDLSKRLDTAKARLGLKGTVPTAEQQAAQMFEEELSRAAINALAICVNYERALGEAQIEYDVGQMAIVGEFTDKEIEELQKKEDEKAKRDNRKPITLTRDYLGPKIDRTQGMLDKMAAKKEKQMQEMEAQIGYKSQESESLKNRKELIASFEALAQENPDLASYVEEFKKDPSASYLLKLEKKLNSEKNNSLASKIQKLRKLADKAAVKAEDPIAYLEKLTTENPVLAGRIAAFKQDISAAIQAEFKKIREEDTHWNSKPLGEKRSILAAVARRVAEKKLDEMYPNHNSDKYIAEHPQRDQSGNVVYEIVKDKHLKPVLEDGKPKLRLKNGKPLPIPAEEVGQRLPGVVAYALNPRDLSVVVRNRREDGMDEPRIKQSVVPPVKPVNINASKPAIEIDPTRKPTPTITFDDKRRKKFFSETSIEALRLEQSAKIGIEVEMTPRKFEEVCLQELPRRLEEYRKGSEELREKFKDVTVSGEDNHYQISRGDTSLVEMVYNPAANRKPAKVDIVLTDPHQEDDSLFLMVASAKKVLEDRRVPNNKKGEKWKFNIENCEDKPEIALKLYLKGLSLGLEPRFKDEKNDEATLKSILDYQKKIEIEGRSEPLSFAEIYEEAKSGRLKDDELKKYMGRLEVIDDKAGTSPAA